MALAAVEGTCTGFCESGCRLRRVLDVKGRKRRLRKFGMVLAIGEEDRMRERSSGRRRSRIGARTGERGRLGGRLSGCLTSCFGFCSEMHVGFVDVSEA